MSRRLIAISILGAAVFYAAISMAAIAGSHHDFTSAGTGAIKSALITDTCGACHVPHKPLQNVPLWAHALSAQTYNLYNKNVDYAGGAAKNLAYDADPASLNGTVSDACLSCHDGTVDVITGSKMTSAMGGYIMWDNGAAVGGPGASGAGMKGSHPIGVNYVTVRAADNAGYKDPTTFTNVSIPGNKVQCNSCHDAHNKAGTVKMLVASNTNSALCVECHIK